MLLNRLRMLLSRTNHRWSKPLSVECSVPLHVRHRRFATNINLPVPRPSLNCRARFKHDSSKTIKPFILSDIGEGINEVVVKSWLVKVGDYVEEFDGICEVESDKAAVTIPSRFEGRIAKIHYEIGDMAKVGSALIDIQVDCEQSQQVEQKEEKIETHTPKVGVQREEVPRAAQDVSTPPKPLEPQIITMPSVRRLAQEKRIDLCQVKPTGKKGQILKEDVLLFLDRGQQQVTTAKSIKQPESKSNQSMELEIPLRGIKRAMFKTMTQSAKIPHFNYSDEIFMDRLVELVKKRNATQTNDKLSNFAIFIKIVSLALKEFPQLNGSVDELGEIFTEKHYHNVGVAVDTSAGLIVPNIKNVQDLSVKQINGELSRLRQLAYASKLGIEDLRGGTITLSNIGAIGGIFGVPVLVTPEIVIGALGKIRSEPRYNSTGGLEERKVMQLVWSADHRVVDGATLSRFTNLLKYYLEEPGMASLDLV